VEPVVSGYPVDSEGISLPIVHLRELKTFAMAAKNGTYIPCLADHTKGASERTDRAFKKLKQAIEEWKP
jgi:hypothetical protein